MAKGRDWGKDRERRQMQNSEPVAPSGNSPLPKPAPAPLPDWMKDRSLLPKKPPGMGGPK